MTNALPSDIGSLNAADRATLKALMRKRKIPALKQRRANALLLLDDGLTELQVAQILYFDVSTVHELISNYRKHGPNCVNLAAYSTREGHLSAVQEAEVIAHFETHPPVIAARCAHTWLRALMFPLAVLARLR